MIRFIDIVLSFLVSPLVLMVLIPASLIKVLFDGFPLFYVSKRVGLNGGEIVVYKFRTMVNDPEKINEYIECISDGKAFQRIPVSAEIYTKTGRLFENLQLVELPQLLNVLLGNMALVGNRPLPRHINLQLVKRYGEELVEDRMSVSPGITGVAQVVGKYKLTDHERLRFEVGYARFIRKSNWAACLYLNFLIIIETVFMIASRNQLLLFNRKIRSMLEVEFQ